MDPDYTTGQFLSIFFPLELYKTKFWVDRASHLLYHSEATFVSLGSYQEKFSSF